VLYCDGVAGCEVSDKAFIVSGETYTCIDWLVAEGKEMEKEVNHGDRSLWCIRK
jgi:hypothetical protein